MRKLTFKDIINMDSILGGGLLFLLSGFPTLLLAMLVAAFTNIPLEITAPVGFFMGMLLFHYEYLACVED